MKKRKGLLLLLTLLIAVTAFTITSQAAVKLNKTSVQLMFGESVKLKVTGTSKKVTWSSSNTSVAQVTSKGKVTAVGCGSCKITAKVGTKKYKCKVKVGSTWVVQAGAYNRQINLAKQFIRVNTLVPDAFWTYHDGVYKIAAGTFYYKDNAIARKNYLLQHGVEAVLEVR